MTEPKDQRVQPYIPAATSLPEITFKAILLAIVLSAVLAGANAYLGLMAGMTVSASIPAAVISMAVLKMFRRSNILENNIVQTAASAGESLAAGVIFTIPALILLGVWTEFHYWETTIIAALGGLIGVMFTIPLRRALVVESDLKFPEGVATAEVLKVGDKAGGGILAIGVGAGLGALFKLGASGLGLWTQSVEGARRVGNSVAYFGSNLGPALLAVGYIVGLNIAVLVFLGGALNWLIAIPIYIATQGWPDADGTPLSPKAAAAATWSGQTRYLGVGAMVVGGLWALIRLRSSLTRGIQSSLKAYREMRSGGQAEVPRTEQDTPIQWVGIALVVAMVPLFFVFLHITGSTGVALFMALAMMVAGFLFSAVASYMAGLVGSSNNPISGVTIATILLSSLLLLVLLGSEDPKGGATAAILIGAVVCCAAAIGGDNMQDLKAGHLLGATPRKQQVMQVIGVLSAAVVIAPVLTLLHKAYTIGSKELPAPQAGLMKSVAEGVFEQNLPWTIISIGALIAVAIILVDLILEARKSQFRTPVLAVAVGIYLPLELSVPILLGGLVAWFVARGYRQRGVGEQGTESGMRTGLLLAAGLITGEALLGILLAIPIALKEGKNPMQLGFEALPMHWPGVVFLAVVIFFLYRFATVALRDREARESA